MLKMPAWKFLKAETSTADAIGEQLAEMDRAYAAADAELLRLGSQRPAILLDTTSAADAKLERHDADMAAARRAMEATGARRAALEVEWRQAEATETAARLDRDRRERHAAAVKARSEAARILDAYGRDAAALAAKLHRLAEIGREIDAVNADLPPDAAPIGPAEPFNGRHATPDVWGTHDVWVDGNGDHRGAALPGQAPPAHGYTRRTVYNYAATPGAPGFPHRPLAARVALPAVDPDAAPFWAPGVAAPRRSVEADAFILQHGIRR